MAKSKSKNGKGSSKNAKKADLTSIHPNPISDPVAKQLQIPGVDAQETVVQASVSAATPALTPASGAIIVQGNANQGFPYFNQLEDEIQQKIWKFSLEPRLMEWGTYAAPPAVFQVNKAARTFARTIYWRSNWAMALSSSAVYINQKIDLLYWKQSPTRAKIPWANVDYPPPWIHKMNHLAVDIMSTGTYKDEKDNIVWRALPNFWFDLEYNCPSLQVLVIILEPTPSGDDTLADLDVVSDWQAIQAAEQPMVLSFLESVDERKIKENWVPECKLMRKKTKKLIW